MVRLVPAARVQRLIRNSGTMSAQSSGRSRAAIWVMVLLAAPVLYVLTFPLGNWVIAKSCRDHIYPRWAMAYAAPYNWLSQQPSLHQPLDDYFWWVFNRLNGT